MVLGFYNPSVQKVRWWKGWNWSYPPWTRTLSL